MSVERTLAQAASIRAYAALMQSKGLTECADWARAEAEKLVKSLEARVAVERRIVGVPLAA